MFRKSTILFLTIIFGIMIGGRAFGVSNQLFEMGKSYYDSGKYDEAVTVLKKAFDEDPSNDRILDLLVNAMVKSENPQEKKAGDNQIENLSDQKKQVQPAAKSTLDRTVLEGLKNDESGDVKRGSSSASDAANISNADNFPVSGSAENAGIQANIQVPRQGSVYAPASINYAGGKVMVFEQSKQNKIAFSDKAVISKIETVVFSDLTRFVIETSQPINFVTEKLTHPNMLVIDLLDAVDNLPRGKNFPVNIGVVKKIRHSQYREIPAKTTRIVIDLTNWNNAYTSSKIDNKIVVDLINPVNLQGVGPSSVLASGIRNLPTVSSAVTEDIEIKIDSYGKKQTAGAVCEEPIALKVLKKGNPADNEKIILESLTPLAGFKLFDKITASVELTSDNKGQIIINNFYSKPTQGENQIRIYSLKNNKSVKTIIIESLTPKPEKIVKISGDNQKANLNSSNEEPFVVEVLDKNGNKVGAGIPVIFSTISKGCKVDVNNTNSFDNEVVVITDNLSRAKCDKFEIGSEPGLKVLKASILVDDPAVIPTKLLVASQTNLSNAVETIIQGLKYDISNDISVMVFETADTFNFKTVRDDLYVSLKEGGNIELYPHLNALFVSDENVFLSDIPAKIMNYASFKISTKTLRSVDFAVNATPRLVTVNFKGAELMDVIRTLAELGDWNITYTEEDVKDKQVNLHLIDVPALTALDTILDMNDLTRVQDGNIMKIVLKSKAAVNALPIRPDYSEEMGIGDNFITQIVPLNNVDGQKLLTTILELKSENGKISYEQNTNSLLITESKSKVKQLVQIIKAFDISAKTSQEDIRIYKLVNENPSKIGEILAKLLEAAKEDIEKAKLSEKSKKNATKKETDKTKTSKTETPEAASAQPAALDGAGGLIGKSGWRLSGDAKIIPYDEKMILLIQTTAANHIVIGSLIKDLDSNAQRKIRMYDLTDKPHINPKNLKDLIINMKSLKANLQKVDEKDDLFIPENGLIVPDKKVTLKESSVLYWGPAMYKTIYPKYQVFTSSTRLLVIGDVDALNEIDRVISELLDHFSTETTDFALESLLSQDMMTKRYTLHHIGMKQIEEYFNLNKWAIPMYIAGLESKQGKEDIIILGDNNLITDFTKKVKSLDIAELANTRLDGTAVEVYKLKNVSVTDVMNMKDQVLVPLMTAAGNITPIEFSQSIIIRDKNYNVNSVKEMLDLIDKKNVETKRIALKHITSKQIEEYFKVMNFVLPFYVGNYESKTGREDIAVIAEKSVIDEFITKLSVIDIPELGLAKLDGITVEIYTLKNISIEDIGDDQMKVLEEALSKDEKGTEKLGSITKILNSNSLIIRDRIYNVNSVKDILKKIDKERSLESVMSTEVLTMRYMDAASLKNTFNNFTNVKSEKGEVVIDYVSNSVIVRDYMPNIKRMKEIIEKLDESAKNSNWLVTKVFNLKYANVSDRMEKNNVKVTKIEEVFDDLFTNSVLALDNKDGKMFGNVAYDERTNSVIITTFRNLMPQVEKLIAQLDKREKQIMIEVLIVEREVSNSDVLGFNTMFGVDRYTAFSNSTSSEADATTGKPVDKVGFSGFGGGFQPGRTEGAAFWLTINAKQFAAALDSLKTTSTAEVLSNPKVLTVNNQPAFVELKDIIQTPKYEKDENGIFKPVDPDKTEIPLSLTVVPQINQDREVMLTVDLKVSTLPADYDKSLGLPPSPTDRVINNMFYIADNQTIVIGGIIKKENRNAESKVPLLDFLEKIPILGALSKKTSKSNLNKELLIFITPHIIEGTIQTEQISKNIKDKYSNIVYNNFYLNIASKSEIATLYLNSIYKNLLENFYEKNRRLGKDDYNITKATPAWLAKENAPAFAEELAKAIIKYREQFGPFTNYEQIQFVQFNFMNLNMNIKEDLYAELASQTTLNLNINLATSEELSRIKGFTYNIAQNIVNERNRLGYFKDKNQARYYIIKNGIPSMYFDEYIGKILVVGDMKDKDSAQTLNDYKYMTEDPEQVKPEDLNIPLKQYPDINLYEEKNYYQDNYNTNQNNGTELPPLPPLPESSIYRSGQNSSSGIFPAGKININLSTAEQLQNELGISRLDAMLIVKYRERIGSYLTVEELKNVYGLEKVYETIKNKITVK
ncbi:MAG TPA: secretin N-terminal domain-containing protein [bacterium]|nr:secretin N-terminal domain-containing protein [bacterium]